MIIKRKTKLVLFVVDLLYNESNNWSLSLRRYLANNSFSHTVNNETHQENQHL